MSGGVRIAVREYGGSGPAVLLVHGGGRTLADWSLVAPLLVPRFRVVAMDLRGHGHSGDGPLVWEDILDDVGSVISHCQLDRPAIVGHSLGGMAAAMWASRVPGCPAAINLDGQGLGRPEQYDGLNVEFVLARQAELRRVGDAMTAALSRALEPHEVDAQVANAQQALASQGFPAKVVEETIRRALDVCDGAARPRPSPEAWTGLLDVMRDVDLVAVYRASRCPLLVVLAAGHGVGGPASEMEWLAEFQAAHRRGLTASLAPLRERRPPVQVEEVDADHMLILNKPDLVAACIIRFLTAHVPGAAGTSALADRNAGRVHND